jgi:hypothetical protein
LDNNSVPKYIGTSEFTKSVPKNIESKLYFGITNNIWAKTKIIYTDLKPSENESKSENYRYITPNTSIRIDSTIKIESDAKKDGNLFLRLGDWSILGKKYNIVKLEINSKDKKSAKPEVILESDGLYFKIDPIFPNDEIRFICDIQVINSE